MNLKPLLEIMRRELRLQERILTAKKEEQRLLAVGRADRLLNLTTELGDLADEARALEEERREITQRLALELGIETPNPTLKEILEILPPYNRSDLEKTRDELVGIVVLVRQQNLTNRLMLTRAVDTLNQELKSLALTPESGVYQANGMKPPVASPPRAGLNVRA